MILIVLISVIILKALTDALFFRGKKRKSKWVEEAWFIILVFFLYQHNRQSDREVYAFIICYYFLRAAIFDSIFNIFAKLAILHTGTTSEWDDYMSRLKTWQYISYKAFFLCIAILIYVKQLA
jgi:hypothetical protein